MNLKISGGPLTNDLQFTIEGVPLKGVRDMKIKASGPGKPILAELTVGVESLEFDIPESWMKFIDIYDGDEFTITLADADEIEVSDR
jgi:hypothetical protein